MKNAKTIFIIFSVVIAGFLFTSCSTTIHATIQRPAELNLNGADSISVLPFQVTDNTSAVQNVLVIGDIINFFSDVKNTANGSLDIADYLTRGLEQGIAGSDYLDLIYSEAVKGALNAGKQAPCDVYLSGTISRYNNEIKQVKRTVTINKEKVEKLYWYRNVEFVLTYQIIDSKTNKIITSRTQDIYRNSDEYEDKEEVETVLQTIRPALDEIVSIIMRQIQPYTETKYISLLKDKTKDPDMKTADKLASRGLLEQSRSLYLDLYNKRHYFEAGYNAAVILEALGDLEGAYDEMQDLVMRYGDSRAINALNDIKFEMESKRTLQEQLDK